MRSSMHTQRRTRAGGGDQMVGNLIANCVRESGDHGPFNSRDWMFRKRNRRLPCPQSRIAFRAASEQLVALAHAL